MKNLGGLLAGILLVASLTGCGNSAPSAQRSESPIIPLAQIDQAKWHDALAPVLPGLRADPDFAMLYSLTVRSLCNEDVSSIATRETLVGATPAADRVSMQMVCPSLAHKVDDALTSIQDATSSFDDACATDPRLRTKAQQDEIDAVGPC